MKEIPQVIRAGALDMQVCVPASWDDEGIENFANGMNPCGTERGWKIRKDPGLLNGDPERNPCESLSGFIHVTLDA